MLFNCFFPTFFICSAYADGLSQYKDFISNPPWIKKMAFAQSGNLFIITYDNGITKTTSGFVLFEASLQPDSWYVQIKTNAPDGESDRSEGNGWVIGKSYQDYWGITADKLLITFTPITGDPKGNVIVVAKRWERKIEMIRKLGLIYLVAGESPDVPESIEWTDNVSFEAKTTTHGIVKGKIVSFTNNFPKRIEFEFSKIPNTTFAVVYTYEAKRDFPPYSIKCLQITKDSTKQLWEFLLPEIEIGSLDSSFNGFSPTNFLASEQIKLATRSIRNGNKVTFITPDGKIVEHKPSAPNYNSITEYKIPEKEIGRVRFVVLSFMVLTFLLFIIFWSKSKKIKQTNKTKGIK